MNLKAEKNGELVARIPFGWSSRKFSLTSLVTSTKVLVKVREPITAQNFDKKFSNVTAANIEPSFLHK